MTGNPTQSSPLTVGAFVTYSCIIFFCAAHLLQVIFLSGAERIPGDLGDSRFNNLVLEHLWQSLNGRGDWASPPMFYPLENTLFMSDTHLGTFPFYAFFRFLGWSMESALQGWAVALALLNATSLIYVFRRLRLPVIMTAALTFFGSSHFVFVGNTGHLQLLPIFPTVFLFYFLYRSLIDGNLRYFAMAAFFGAYQHFCVPYYGYFSALLLGISIIIFIFLHADVIRHSVFDQADKLKGLLLVIAIVSTAVAALAWFYWRYYQSSVILGEKHPSEVALLTPTWRAWVTAIDNSIFYSKMQALPMEAWYNYELRLFAGFGTLIGGLVLFFFSWKFRHAGRYATAAFPLIASILIAVVLITRWPGFGESLYMFFVVHVPSIRAFRAIGRILCLMIPLMALALAFLYSAEKLPVAVKRVLYVLSIILAIEALSRSMPGYSKADAQERTEAVKEAFAGVNSNSVIAFAPGAVGQNPIVINIDAMCGAWVQGCHVLNGYSGSIPQKYSELFYSLQPENARALAEKIDMQNLVIRDEYPVWFILKHNLKPFIAINPQIINKYVSVKPNDKFDFNVSLKNQLDRDVYCENLNLNLSYRLFAERDRVILAPEPLRTSVPMLPVNTNMPVTMHIRAPNVPGIYRARISMVAEGSAWWFDVDECHGFDLLLEVVGDGEGESAKKCYTQMSNESINHTQIQFFTSGWSSDEPEFRWSEGKISSMRFRLPEAASIPVQIHINGRSLGEQQFDIMLNGKLVFSGVLNGDGTIVIPVNDQILADKMAKLIFIWKNARTPGNGDPRILAFAIKNLTLEY